MITMPMKTIGGKRLWGIWFKRRIRQIFGMPEFTYYRCECGYNPRTDSLRRIRTCSSCGRKTMSREQKDKKGA